MRCLAGLPPPLPRHGLATFCACLHACQAGAQLFDATVGDSLRPAQPHTKHVHLHRCTLGWLAGCLQDGARLYESYGRFHFCFIPLCKVRWRGMASAADWECVAGGVGLAGLLLVGRPADGPASRPSVIVYPSMAGCLPHIPTTLCRLPSRCCLLCRRAAASASTDAATAGPCTLPEST